MLHEKTVTQMKKNLMLKLFIVKNMEIFKNK